MSDGDLHFGHLATLPVSSRVEASGEILHRICLSLVATGGVKAWQVRGELQKLALRWTRLEKDGAKVR